jgi:hypothetical protein
MAHRSFGDQTPAAKPRRCTGTAGLRAAKFRRCLSILYNVSRLETSQSDGSTSDGVVSLFTFPSGWPDHDAIIPMLCDPGRSAEPTRPVIRGLDRLILGHS